MLIYILYHCKVGGWSTSYSQPALIVPLVGGSLVVTIPVASHVVVTASVISVQIEKLILQVELQPQTRFLLLGVQSFLYPIFIRQSALDCSHNHPKVICNNTIVHIFSCAMSIVSSLLFAIHLWRVHAPRFFLLRGEG